MPVPAATTVVAYQEEAVGTWANLLVQKAVQMVVVAGMAWATQAVAVTEVSEKAVDAAVSAGLAVVKAPNGTGTASYGCSCLCWCCCPRHH